MRKILLSLLGVLVLAAGGIGGYHMYAAHERGEALPGPAGVMPQVVNTDINRTAQSLLTEGFHVRVVREERTEKVAGGRTVTLPRVERDYRPGEWNHMIGAQSPQPGASLVAGETITLFAGMHHGFGPVDAWVRTHGHSIAM